MREVIQTASAPAAIGPYSQAVKCDGLIFSSGQIPLSPSTGSLITGSIQDQTRQILANISSLLKDQGLGLDSIVKTNIFLTDLAYFEDVNEVYAELFSPPYPARSTVQVSALPMGSAIEIEFIAKA